MLEKKPDMKRIGMEADTGIEVEASAIDLERVRRITDGVRFRRDRLKESLVAQRAAAEESQVFFMRGMGNDIGPEHERLEEEYRTLQRTNKQAVTSLERELASAEALLLDAEEKLETSTKLFAATKLARTNILNGKNPLPGNE